MSEVDESPQVDLRALLEQQLEDQLLAGPDQESSRIPRRPDPDAPARLSPTQANLWFGWQYDPTNISYHLPLVIRLRGRVEPDELAGAVRDLVRRHEVLRTVVETHDGEPVAVVRPVDDVPVEVRVPTGPLADLLDEQARRPFALDSEPPLRAVVVPTGPDQAVLALTVHHIATDGWSQDVLVRDLLGLYAARLGLADPPEPPRLQYADVTEWLSTQDTDRDERLAWWEEQLRGMPAALQLPTDRPEPAQPRWESGVVPLEVPVQAAERVRACATAAGSSPFMVLMAALQALLARVCHTDDLVVGVPEAGRHHPDTEHLVGCFLNVLVVRGDLRGDPTGRALLDRVRQRMLDAFGNSGVSLERIVERVRPGHRPGTPLYQVQFNVHPVPAAPEPVPGVDVEVDYTVVHSAKFDLNVELADHGAGGPMRGNIEFRRDLFDDQTVGRLADWFLAVLDGMLSDLDAPVGTVPLEPVTGPLLAGPARMATASDDVRDLPLHEHVERWADARPHAVAVVGPDTTRTYADLDRHANQIAHRLLSCGVRPDEPVGVLLEPGAGYVAAVLGVLKAGGAYLPVDTAFPVGRVHEMLTTGRARVVVTTTDLVGRVVGGGRTVLALDDPATLSGQRQDRPAVPVRPDNLLHVIFTSGSTGTPKGIAVEHRGVANCMAGMLEVLGDAAGGSFAVVSTVAADLGLACFYGALLTGGTLHMVDRETATDPAAFAEYLRRHPVDVVKMVPSHLTLLATHGELADVLPRALLVFGGEACPWTLVDRVRAVRPDLRVHTHYGPTESSMFSLVCDVDEVPAHRRTGTVPLGRVLPNVGVHVLDRAGRPLPAGVAGELALVGPGVSRGYVGRPDLTEARFVPDPAGNPGRCYRTGDLVRIRRDGTVDFLGRVDDQVKVRGHRVELGEVAAACRAVPGVADAVVLPHGQAHDRRLVGWLVPRPGTDLEPASVRAALRDTLPDYMVPASLAVLDRLPLNANGKVDRVALPWPSDVDDTGRPTVVAPRTDTERAVAAVWGQVLGVPEVGVHDDFFALGGHSFAATRAVGRLREALRRDLPLRLLFEHPVLADFAAAIDNGTRDGATGGVVTDAGTDRIPRRSDPDAPTPLSPTQAWWWLFSQLNPDSPVCNVPVVLRLSGPLDADALLSAARDVAERHRVLRSVVRVEDGEPVAVVGPAEAVPVSLRDVDAAGVDAAVRAETSRPFALDTEPAMRVALLRVRPDEHALVLTFHHLATDAWSLELTVADLAACYAARVGSGPRPAPPALEHADYVAWSDAAGTDAGVDWWCERLAGAPDVLDLPADRPRPSTPAGPGGTVPAVVPTGLAERVRVAAAATGGTPFMVLLAAWQALLARLSGNTDVPVGVPVSGRNHPDTDGVVGCFANTVVLRTDIPPDVTGRTLVARVRDTALEAFAHADVPFGRVAQRMHPGRESRDRALFPVMMNFIDAAGPLPSFVGVRVAGYDRPVGDVELDLNLVLVDRGPDYRGGLSYRADLFDRTTAERICRWYLAVLDGIVSDLDRPVAAVELVSAEERAALLAAGTGAPLPDGRPATVPAAVLAQADRRPAAVAAESPQGSSTYAELADWSRRVAAGLVAAGVAPGDTVGVCVPRDHLMPAALLAVWLSGAAYLPLDPDYPAERSRWLVADAGVRFVVARGAALHAAEQVHEVPVVDLDELAGAAPGSDVPLPAVGPDDLAYLIYTSGSTGRPKGVEVTHANLAAQVVAYAAMPGLSDVDSMLAAAALTFDQGSEEIWTPLSVGGRCVVADRESVVDGHDLAEQIRTSGITVADLSVALARVLLATGWTPTDRLRVWTGTEALDSALVRALLPHAAKLWNTYGPTEATIMCTAHPVTAADAERGSVPIGRPMPGNRVYVVDAHGGLAPVGVVGELWVGGAGVARGYRGRPEATEAAFVADPFVPGGRCYRTGDLVRWTADHVLEFVGRRDHQTKIRGHRVELGEIESTLHEHPDVAQAAVAVRGSGGDATLVGYLVPSTVDPAAVQAFVQARLPEHMVPRRWVTLDALPLLHSGKVDRRGLPEPTAPAEGPRVPPTTDAEHLVAEAWAEVLGCDEVFASDDFFALGGNSFAAVRVVGRLREALALPVPVRLLFDHPGLHDFAAALERLLLAELSTD